MEWGKFKFDDNIFKLCKITNKLSKADLENGGKVPVYSSDSNNNGIIGFTNINPEFLITEEHQFYIVFGDHTRSFNIATESFCVADNVKVLSVNQKFTIKILLYIISAWKKGIPNKGYSRHWSIAEKVYFQLPIKNGEIDFDFMESFIAELEAQHIAELEAYLLSTGLKDYTLTSEEEKVLRDFESGKFERGEFTYSNIFNKIQQGRRLKKEDQISGDIPFVMAGTTNTGVVNYISNPVASFPKNSITIDIFGNTFYRNYDFGAGDDTGVYWDSENNYSKKTMLFFTALMGKSISGKYSFGNKLRSSQSFDFKIQIPTQNQQPDYKIIDTFISAIQKLVIRDVVIYADKKIEATKSVVSK